MCIVAYQNLGHIGTLYMVVVISAQEHWCDLAKTMASELADSELRLAALTLLPHEMPYFLARCTPSEVQRFVVILANLPINHRPLAEGFVLYTNITNHPDDLSSTSAGGWSRSESDVESEGTAEQVAEVSIAHIAEVVAATVFDRVVQNRS